LEVRFTAAGAKWYPSRPRRKPGIRGGSARSDGL